MTIQKGIYNCTSTTSCPIFIYLGKKDNEIFQFNILKYVVILGNSETKLLFVKRSDLRKGAF